MDDQTPWARLAKYIAGECSPEEVREIETWIEADPSHKELVRELRQIWTAAGDPPTETSEDSFDLESEWEDLRGKMAVDEQSSPSDDFASSRGPSLSRQSEAKGRRAFGVLIAVFLVVGGLLLGQYLLQPAPTSENDTKYREVVTNRGERARLQLSDGTNVQINADSKLRLPKTFNSHTRTVHLTGEAYFTVADDSTRPFHVKTGTATVDVLGTAFNVRAYPNEEEVQVAVEEGNVSLHSGQNTQSAQEAELGSGVVGRAAAGSPIVVEELDLDPYIGWTKGRLVFDAATLPEVATRLERWFGVEVEIRDSSLRSLQLTANLKSRSLRDVLDVVAASLDIQYRIDDDTVLLVP